MLDLQVTDLTTNNENLPPTLDPQNKKIAPQLNQMFKKTRRGMWIDETFEVVMDVIERGIYSLRKANRSWNLPMSSLVDHLHGKTKSRKMGP